jgi:hypothetical protein
MNAACSSGPGGDSTAGSCGRRVVKLYLAAPPQRYFLCRSCSRITYTSKLEQPWLRARRRAAKWRQRLGITETTVPDIPQGMSVDAYAQLLEETLLLETQATEATTNRLLQIVDWAEKHR